MPLRVVVSPFRCDAILANASVSFPSHCQSDHSPAVPSRALGSPLLASPLLLISIPCIAYPSRHLIQSLLFRCLILRFSTGPPQRKCSLRKCFHNISTADRSKSAPCRSVAEQCRALPFHSLSIRVSSARIHCLSLLCLSAASPRHAVPLESYLLHCSVDQCSSPPFRRQLIPILSTADSIARLAGQACKGQTYLLMLCRQVLVRRWDRWRCSG